MWASIAIEGMSEQLLIEWVEEKEGGSKRQKMGKTLGLQWIWRYVLK